MKEATCPACGEPAECGMAKGASTCWCFALPHVLPIPPDRSDVRCFCRACLERLVSDRAAASTNGALMVKVDVGEVVELNETAQTIGTRARPMSIRSERSVEILMSPNSLVLITRTTSRT
jgi:hypothetical protein